MPEKKQEEQIKKKKTLDANNVSVITNFFQIRKAAHNEVEEINVSQC